MATSAAGSGHYACLPLRALTSINAGHLSRRDCQTMNPPHATDPSTDIQVRDLPLAKVYQVIEPGPVVLLTTRGKSGPNIMTMSWHMMVEFTPPLIACVVSSGTAGRKRVGASRCRVFRQPRMPGGRYPAGEQVQSLRTRSDKGMGRSEASRPEDDPSSRVRSVLDRRRYNSHRLANALAEVPAH